MNQNKDQKLDAEIGTRIADIRGYFHVSQDALAVRKPLDNLIGSF